MMSLFQPMQRGLLGIPEVTLMDAIHKLDCQEAQNYLETFPVRFLCSGSYSPERLPLEQATLLWGHPPAYSLRRALCLCCVQVSHITSMTSPHLSQDQEWNWNQAIKCQLSCS
jgi:hypothetical protein